MKLGASVTLRATLKEVRRRRTREQPPAGGAESKVSNLVCPSVQANQSYPTGLRTTRAIIWPRQHKPIAFCPLQCELAV